MDTYSKAEFFHDLDSLEFQREYRSSQSFYRSLEIFTEKYFYFDLSNAIEEIEGDLESPSMAADALTQLYLTSGNSDTDILYIGQLGKSLRGCF